MTDKYFAYATQCTTAVENLHEATFTRMFKAFGLLRALEYWFDEYSTRKTDGFEIYYLPGTTIRLDFPYVSPRKEKIKLEGWEVIGCLENEYAWWRLHRRKRNVAPATRRRRWRKPYALLLRAS